MSVYVIARIDIHDRARYGEYEAGFMDIFSQYAGQVLGVDEAPQVLEGNWACTRTVLIEFPTREDMLAWYHSDAYQDLVQHRFAASTADIALIQGLETPT